MNTKIKFAAKIQRKNFNNDKSSFSWVHVPWPLLTYVLFTFLLSSLNKKTLRFVTIRNDSLRVVTNYIYY